MGGEAGGGVALSSRDQTSSKVPVLLLIHSRADTTSEVFESIRRYEPSKLYVVADGPRAEVLGEQAACAGARAVATNVSWECEVSVLFHEQNLGLRLAARSALDWFFSLEEMGILLEDDTLPNETFWFFAEKLLHRYKDDYRVGFICGSNHADHQPAGASSYFFSNLPTYTWGIALWRRTWVGVEDIGPGVFHKYRKLWKSIMTKSKFKAYWVWAMQKLDSLEWNSFHWSLYLSTVSRGSLVVFPAANLVRNVGFDSRGTHLRRKPWRINNETLELGEPFRHPASVSPDLRFAEVFFERLLPERRVLNLGMRRLLRRFFGARQ